MDVFMSPSNTVSEQSTIISELKSIKEELYATRNELKEFRNEMACISSSIIVCNERIDGIENRLECLEKRLETHSINNDESLKATVDQLKADFNEREQDLLLNDIDITGIPESKGENPYHIVMLIAAKLSVKIDEQDITRAERIGPIHGSKEGENATRPIVVRLSRKTLRDDILRAAQQMWIELQHKGLRLAIGTVYRPETQNIGNSIEELSETLSSLSAYSFQCLLTDFNIDLLNSSSNDTKEFLRSLDQQNYTQLVQEPTRITMTSATLLDLIIIDTPMLCTKIEVIHNPCLSDHALILADFDIKKQKDGVKSITKRCFNDIDEEEFGEDLKNISWNKIKESESINEMVAKFNCEILNLFDKHAPVKVIKIKNNSYPWITEVIKIMMEKRDEALKKAHNSKNDASWSYYKMFKNFTNASIKREKKAYINFYVNKNANRPVLMWQHFKKISPLGKGNSGCIPPHLQEPDKINDFFMTLPGNEITDLKTLAQFTTNRDSNTEFFIKECSKEQVLNIINNISSNAIGHDNISITMIKLTLPVTLDIITYIINQSIKTHTFPDSWKIAKVIPLPKITSVENYKDLRPISILPVMSKIIEKIVCMQLTTYLETHNILPEHQSGFRKAHGTAAALSAVTDDILSASDNGKKTVCFYRKF
ncbi:uncharacterized protein LOC126779869 [Nymphalis io]|uniref:uncharacterized protein LOC126779869 n=1 Tax=Inachis io TaxID=171585 RepID=UPI00216967D4|nr:uncharacterized protein LOC126779869 [Nymphalis io]